MNQADLIVARIERARQDRGISVAELARLCAVMDMSLACFLTREQASDLAETRRRMAEDYGPTSHAGPFRF